MPDFKQLFFTYDKIKERQYWKVCGGLEKFLNFWRES